MFILCESIVWCWKSKMSTGWKYGDSAFDSSPWFQWAKISKLPPILTLPLQRFVYDIKTGNRQKKTSRFEFPFEMDLKEFCEVNSIEILLSHFIFHFAQRILLLKRIMNYLLWLFIAVLVIQDITMFISKISIKLAHGLLHLKLKRHR